MTHIPSRLTVTWTSAHCSRRRCPHAEDRDCNGVNYLNCGDGAESCTALAENYDGSFEILYWDKIREQYLDNKEIIKPIKTEELKKAS